MSAFFRPWRRRIGVLTLLIAMVFMALWLRSIRTEDVVSMKTRNGRFEYLLISSNSDLRVWRLEDALTLAESLVWSICQMASASQFINTGNRYRGTFPALDSVWNFF